MDSGRFVDAHSSLLDVSFVLAFRESFPVLGSASSLNGAMPLQRAPNFSMGAVRHPQKGRGSWLLGNENSLCHGALLHAASLGALSSPEEKSTSSLAESNRWEVAGNNLMPLLTRSFLNCWEQNTGSGTASSENLGEDLWASTGRARTPPVRHLWLNGSPARAAECFAFFYRLVS